MKISFKLSTLAAAMLAGGLSMSAQAAPVALELALLVDVSGSVSTSEYNLQKDGYINAFRSATIQSTIASLGGIAVTYVEWSSASQQAQLVGWTLITDAASANAFADAIDASNRAFSGTTYPGSAISYITPQFANNGYEGARWVIDVSGDGTGESTTAAARDTFLASAPTGVTTAVNGLAIGGSTSLFNWYDANIKGGDNAFVIQAEDFEAFGSAVQNKLYREITGGGEIPAPATVALLGLGLLVAGAARRKA